MVKLLRANFSRMLRDKAFIICTALMFLLGAALPLYLYFMTKDSGYTPAPDEACFVFSIFIVIAASVFTSLFIGTEHSDGTIRNKIIVGHKKSSIYFSDVLLCVTSSLMMCIAYLVPFIAISLPLLGKFVMAPSKLILILLAVFCMSAAFTCLFVLVSLMSRNKAASAIICMVGALVLTFSGYMISSRLNEPEFYDSFVYTDEFGNEIKQDMMVNSNYLGGAKREVYETLYDLSPGGQVVQFLFDDVDKPATLIGYDLLLCVLISGVGVLAFKKKDLK